MKVPDIGDFKDVAVIECYVKPGDTVEDEQSLVTLESDKATMDMPSPAAGTVKELKVKVGDKVRKARDPHARRRGRRRGCGRAEAAAAPPRRSSRGACRRARAEGRQLRRHRPTSNATCSCSAPAPAAIPPRSAPPTSA